MNRTFGRLARAALDLGVPTDSQLLAEFVTRRDDAAFAALVRRHGSMVLAVCRRVLRHEHDAEDAFQATFLVLARKAEDVWPREAVGAWLHGVAYRVAMKARGVRARQARREHPLQDVSHLPLEPHPDLADVLDRAIRKLPEEYRAAVVACDLEGRTRKDAAEQLGWKEGTLSGRLSRARQLLAARLKKMGLAVPVALGAAEAVPTALAESVVRAVLNTSAGVSAPVAALTEGVVRSMFLAKVKTLAATVLVAGVMGLGVWSASGQGPGAGAGERTGVSGPRAVAAAAPADLERLQGEWIIGRPFIQQTSSHLSPTLVEEGIENARKDGSLVVIDGATMSWPLASAGATSTTSEGGSTGTATADQTTLIPRTFTIRLDPTQSPKHIDLTDEKGTVTKGIYKTEDWDLVICMNEKGGRPKGFGKERVKDDEPLWTLWQPRPPQPQPKKAAVPPAPRPELAALELEVLAQELDAVRKQKNPDPIALDRLRARLDAAQRLVQRTAPPPDRADEAQQDRIEWARRMVKLGYMTQAQLEWEMRAGDPDVKALQGRWKIERLQADGDVTNSSLYSRAQKTFLEFSGNNLLMPYLDSSVGEKTVLYTFAVDSSKSPKEIDLIANGKPVGKGVYEFTRSPGTVGLRLAFAENGKRPTFDGRRSNGVVAFELSRPAGGESVGAGAREANDAEAQYHAARRKLDAVRMHVHQSQRDLAAAEDELAAAFKAVAARRAASTPPSFTLHVRTPLAAETSEAVSLPASMTVLDVFDTYKTLNDLRRKGGLSVWVVRDEKVMPVDIVGITDRGITTTNYQLKNWDKVFVQVNVGK